MKTALFALIVSLACLDISAQLVVNKSTTTTGSKAGIEITLYQGKPFTGNATVAYSNGNIQSNQTFKDGITTGLWQEWYENGKLKFSLNWLNGKGHGLWEYYHENGMLRSEETFNIDIPTGISLEYYNNGQLKMKWNWLNGKKNGFQTYYSEAGTITKTELYENNNLVNTK